MDWPFGCNTNLSGCVLAKLKDCAAAAEIPPDLRDGLKNEVNMEVPKTAIPQATT